jgi:DNA (cytosine-5)-methyltransferase 1
MSSPDLVRVVDRDGARVRVLLPSAGRLVTRRPVLLDLFACAGAAGDGYARAGFDVIAVDLDRRALRHNPHRPVVADALDVLAGRVVDLDRVDAIHASPPCQAYSHTRHAHDVDHPELVPAVLDALDRIGLPYVVENVPGAPLPGALTLCGSEFGLRAHDPGSGRVVALRRHRLFASNVDVWGAGGCSCAADRAAQRIAGVYDGARRDHVAARVERRGGYAVTDRDAAAALLGIDRPIPWRYLTQAIPPAYTAHIGEHLMHAVRERRG